MILKFDTSSGGYSNECKKTLLSVTATQTIESTVDMLENGWLPDPFLDCWYMSRSTRIDLKKWKPSDSYSRSHKSVNWSTCDDTISDQDLKLLISYRKNRMIPDYPIERLLKGEKILMSRGEFEGGRCWCIVTVNKDSTTYPLCAYVSDHNRISAGKACWTQACKISINEGANYMYTFEGYCNENSYKASIPGFEWWTGSEWQHNPDEYLRLLKLDVNA